MIELTQLLNLILILFQIKKRKKKKANNEYDLFENFLIQHNKNDINYYRSYYDFFMEYKNNFLNNNDLRKAINDSFYSQLLVKEAEFYTQINKFCQTFDHPFDYFTKNGRKYFVDKKTKSKGVIDVYIKDEIFYNKNSTNEKYWSDQFWNMIKQLPEDSLLTVYYCSIKD